MTQPAAIEFARRDCIRDGTPIDRSKSACEWGEQNIRLIGSARSERFDPLITPWLIEPLNKADSGEVRSLTIVGPVQSGKSVIGEILSCKWIASGESGDIYVNWPDDSKAGDRWDKRFEKILRACKPAMARAPDQGRHVGKWSKGKIIFPHCNFVFQGVWDPSNLESESIRRIINEEVHDWKPGRLMKAYNRTTAVWNAIVANISSGGLKGGQLDVIYQAGTMQEWMVLCPHCGNHHEMKTEWNDRYVERGGLRYDAEGCRLEDGQYDYGKLEPTIRYQFPCGQSVPDRKEIRRKMSLGGAYSEPKNKGAAKGDLSYHLDAVAVDYIPWLTLIKQKHQALTALRRGDPEPWFRYLQEREAKMIDKMERPPANRIVVNVKTKKNRKGMRKRAARFAALDYQQGNLRRGELPHWWLVIRDFDQVGNSLLVYEGKIETDDGAANVITEHGVVPACVVVDSGFNAMHVYRFCLKHGFNAIKGSSEGYFPHSVPDAKTGKMITVRKIFSVEKPLHEMINVPPTQDDPNKEPLFWFYSKAGIRDLLDWLMNSDELRFDIPGDVSEDYKMHMESEEFQKTINKKTMEETGSWVKIHARNDLRVCEAYCVMEAQMGELIGEPKG